MSLLEICPYPYVSKKTSDFTDLVGDRSALVVRMPLTIIGFETNIFLNLLYGVCGKVGNIDYLPLPMDERVKKNKLKQALVSNNVTLK